MLPVNASQHRLASRKYADTIIISGNNKRGNTSLFALRGGIITNDITLAASDSDWYYPDSLARATEPSWMLEWAAAPINREQGGKVQPPWLVVDQLPYCWCCAWRCTRSLWRHLLARGNRVKRLREKILCKVFQMKKVFCQLLEQ